MWSADGDEDREMAAVVEGWGNKKLIFFVHSTEDILE